MAELYMPCWTCLGEGQRTGYFLYTFKKGEETRPCEDCGGTGQVRDYEGEELEAEAKAPRRGGMALYDPVTRQWWPPPFRTPKS